MEKRRMKYEKIHKKERKREIEGSLMRAEGSAISYKSEQMRPIKSRTQTILFSFCLPPLLRGAFITRKTKELPKLHQVESSFIPPLSLSSDGIRVIKIYLVSTRWGVLAHSLTLSFSLCSLY